MPQAEHLAGGKSMKLCIDCRWITVQCPPEFAAMMVEAGGVWEPGQRVWLCSCTG
jgi:hypothetical protein